MVPLCERERRVLITSAYIVGFAKPILRITCQIILWMLFYKRFQRSLCSGEILLPKHQR